MKSFDRIIRELIQTAPHMLLVNFLKEKIQKENPDYELNVELAEALASYLESNSCRDKKFEWDDGREEDVELKININEEDLNDFSQIVDDFVKNQLPTILNESSDSVAEIILNSLDEDWKEQTTYEQYQTSSFKNNLEDRWGEALDVVRMMRTVSLEIGEKAYKRLCRSKARKNRILRSVLLRLHARAIKVAGEVVVLMENGYADGAMARWRTLHEISTISWVLIEGGEEIAKRYADHRVIEDKAELDEFQRCHIKLGYAPISEGDQFEINKQFDAALGKYGNEFKSPYGWACELLKKKKPILSDLEKVASNVFMRTYYKFASLNVHASSKGITSHLSAGPDKDIILAGASNAGLDEPGIQTAFSLTNINLALNYERMNKFDEIIFMKIFLKLRSRAEELFLDATNQLEKDEAECGD